MRNIIMLAVVVVVGIALSGICFAEDNDVFKKHEKWIGRVLAGNSDGPLVVSGSLNNRIKGEKPVQFELPCVSVAKADLGQRLGINEKKIKDFGFEIVSAVTTMRWPTGDSEIHYKIGLVYKDVTYIYDGYEFFNGSTGEHTAEAVFTGTTIPKAYDEKGNLILDPVGIGDDPSYGAGHVIMSPKAEAKPDDPWYGAGHVILPKEEAKKPVSNEVLQRLDIQEVAQAQTEGAMFVGQMAGEKREVLPLQQKQ